MAPPRGGGGGARRRSPGTGRCPRGEPPPRAVALELWAGAPNARGLAAWKGVPSLRGAVPESRCLPGPCFSHLLCPAPGSPGVRGRWRLGARGRAALASRRRGRAAAEPAASLRRMRPLGLLLRAAGTPVPPAPRAELVCAPGPRRRVTPGRPRPLPLAPASGAARQPTPSPLPALPVHLVTRPAARAPSALARDPRLPCPGLRLGAWCGEGGAPAVRARDLRFSC